MLTNVLSSLEQLQPSAPNVDEFFRDTNIFITGGTGFLGKVLIEKLLRSCVTINNIYVLLREKYGTKPDDRLASLLSSSIYEKLKEDQPDVFEKLKVICGDLEEENLGLSKEDEQLLKDNIHIVFHVGASVRFDDPIKKAILLNTRGTRDLINLAKQMKNLKVFQHVSTAYCNIDRPIIDEVVYPAKADYRLMIKMAETMKPEILNCLQAKILNGLPNTYVFTKSLAENIVYDQRDHIPCVIYRPSIVFNTYEEPVRGWVDNLNGPIGLIVGGGTGIVHTVYGNKDSENEWIPADVVIRGMIASAWYQGTREDRKSCLVVNAGMSNQISVPLGKIIKDSLKITYKIPFNMMMWYPFVYLTASKRLHQLRVFLYHILPALFLDRLLEIKGDKMRLMKIYRKAYFANDSLSPFMLNCWKFMTKNFLSLDEVTKPEDRVKYSPDLKHLDYDKMRYYTARGLIHYYFNDRDYDKKKAKAKLQRFYFMHLAVQGLFYALVLYVVWMQFISRWY